MKKIRNRSATSCYCGSKEKDSLSMLECVKCRRWFHAGCTKCLDLPMLLGDHFYIFVCSVCNVGSEYLGRIEMEWQEIAHLLLYNLGVLEKKKYFHLDDQLVPFLQNNWERFRIFGSVASEKKDMRSKLLQVLKTSSDRFKCGKEIKKCKNNWALRMKIPPDPPQVVPSAAHLQKDVIVWDFQIQDRAYHLITVQKSRKNKENAKSKSKSATSSSGRQKNGEVSKCSGSVSNNENKNTKTKSNNKRTSSPFNENDARPGLLDSLIPIRSNFNPFEAYFGSSSPKCPSNEEDVTVKKRGRKRRQNAEQSIALNVTNGCVQSLEENPSKEFPRMSTEDIKFHISKGDVCILGRRKASNGKVQYLLELNR